MVTLTRSKEYRDSLRKYKVFVDNKYIGDIKDGEKIELGISPGKHNIYIKIDWCRSENYEFESTDGKDIELKCGNSIDGMNIMQNILYTSIRRKKYIWIKQ